jgi:hypothetical protein
LLFPSSCHDGLGRQGLRARCALAACGRLRTLTAALRRAASVSGNPARHPSQGKTMTNLLTDEQREQLLSNGRQSTENPHFDPPPVVKLFTPDAGATWLLTELDAEDLAFGLCDLGQGFPELGYVSLAELEGLRGRWDLPIERDLHFVADKPLSGYAREARLAGRIVA